MTEPKGVPGSPRSASERGDQLLAYASRGRRAATLVPASRAGRAAGGLFLALFVLLPFMGLHLPWVLPGTVDVINSPGTLEVFGLGFVFALVALGFDLLFGFTGLLSFGQALYFAAGAYLFDIALSDWQWAFVPAILLGLGVCLVLSLTLGAISLRVDGIAFAMVTLAFAQAGYYVIEMNPHNLTGGDNGLVMATSHLSGLLVGVNNTKVLYWVALAVLVVGYLVVWWATESAAGRVWLAIRENERRVEVLGIRSFPYKLAAFVLSSLLAGAGGIVYVLLIGTASPDSIASSTVTISLLVMVVLGGLGTRWGAVVGAMVYIYLQQVLVKVAAEPSFASLPAVLRVPLAQPEFLLGAMFVLFVLFAPGGIAGLVLSARARLSRRSGNRRVRPNAARNSDKSLPSLEPELTAQ